MPGKKSYKKRKGPAHKDEKPVPEQNDASSDENPEPGQVGLVQAGSLISLDFAIWQYTGVSLYGLAKSYCPENQAYGFEIGSFWRVTFLEDPGTLGNKKQYTRRPGYTFYKLPWTASPYSQV